jgi:hypothetical protein
MPPVTPRWDVTAREEIRRLADDGSARHVLDGSWDRPVTAVSAYPSPELEDTQGAGHDREDDADERGDEESDRQRRLPVPAEEGHLYLLGVLSDEDDEQQEQDRQCHRREPGTAGA